MVRDEEFPSRPFLLYWRANAVSGFGTYITLLALQTLVVLTKNSRPNTSSQCRRSRSIPWPTTEKKPSSRHAGVNGRGSCGAPVPGRVRPASVNADTSMTGGSGTAMTRDPMPSPAALRWLRHCSVGSCNNASARDGHLSAPESYGSGQATPKDGDRVAGQDVGAFDGSVPLLIVKVGHYPLHHGGIGAIRTLAAAGVPTYAVTEDRFTPDRALEPPDRSDHRPPRPASRTTRGCSRSSPGSGDSSAGP